METPLVFVGDTPVSPAEAYRLCEGKLLCQASPSREPVLVDFEKDHGLIGPALFLHRLVAETRSPLSRSTAPSGMAVHLSDNRKRLAPEGAGLSPVSRLRRPGTST